MEDQGSTQFNLSMSQLHTFLNSHGLLEQCKPALDQLLSPYFDDLSRDKLRAVWWHAPT